ncbi:MAG TPA: hypothetical protein VM511_02195, partial [Luteolibacter sp.]|nr:hypothetical protein [Luteolibacter sp.]
MKDDWSFYITTDHIITVRQKKMKSITRAVSTFFSFALLHSCSPPQLKEYRHQASLLPAGISRVELYRRFPPKVPPRPFPIFRSGSGLRGMEAYPIDDTYALES